mmetsp:Transcript_94718/g.187678  ORF Transcript_94718/g.187678 Transcript_94718/m.187678 type:complete len:83 (+) Transcript_94718:942-1190(+)
MRPLVSSNTNRINTSASVPTILTTMSQNSSPTQTQYMARLRKAPNNHGSCACIQGLHGSPCIPVVEAQHLVLFMGYIRSTIV